MEKERVPQQPESHPTEGESNEKAEAVPEGTSPVEERLEQEAGPESLQQPAAEERESSKNQGEEELSETPDEAEPESGPAIIAEEGASPTIQNGPAEATGNKEGSPEGPKTKKADPADQSARKDNEVETEPTESATQKGIEKEAKQEERPAQIEGSPAGARPKGEQEESETKTGQEEKLVTQTPVEATREDSQPPIQTHGGPVLSVPGIPAAFLERLMSMSDAERANLASLFQVFAPAPGRLK